jgi:hypothetical protein
VQPWITIEQVVGEFAYERAEQDGRRRYFLNAWQPARPFELDRQRIGDDYRRLAGAPPRDPYPAPVLVKRHADGFGLVEHHVWTRQSWADVVDAAARCDRNPCTCAAVSRAVVAGRRNGRAIVRQWTAA